MECNKSSDSKREDEKEKKKKKKLQARVCFLLGCVCEGGVSVRTDTGPSWVVQA